MTLGGLWADLWRKRAPRARLYVGMCTAVLPLPFFIWMMTTENTWLAFVLYVPTGVGASMWLGPGASTVQDLVMPRLRATAAAAYLLVVTFVGLALGPYTIGRLSVTMGSLRWAMLATLATNAAALIMFVLAARHLEHDEARHGHRLQKVGGH